jgi:hypothetical protein
MAKIVVKTDKITSNKIKSISITLILVAERVYPYQVPMRSWYLRSTERVNGGLRRDDMRGMKIGMCMTVMHFRSVQELSIVG